jgi:ATP synthase F1 complex assembly factor 1
MSTAADIHFLQWHFPPRSLDQSGDPPTTVLFTHLSEYKLRGEYATPHTTITHHLDLAESKGLVLLNGNVTEGRGISVEEGSWLVMCLQRFYGGMGTEEGKGEGGGKRRRELVEMFGRGDGRFDLGELVEEAGKTI